MGDNEQRKDKAVIDEQLLMAAMAGEEPLGQSLTEEMPSQKPVNKERGRSKKMQDVDFESLFLKNPDTNARNGKSVYIRPEFHERLSRIVQVIGEDKISIYAYLDNILANHFSEYADQIISSFNEKYKPII